MAYRCHTGAMGGRTHGALLLTVVMAIVAFTVVCLVGVWLSPHRADLSTYGAYAVALITLAGGWIAWAWRDSGQQADGTIAGQRQLADLLAGAAEQEWRRAANERGLLAPQPIPVQWRRPAAPFGGPVAAAAALTIFPPLPGLGTIGEKQLRVGLVKELHAVYGGLGSGRLVIAGSPGSGESLSGIAFALSVWLGAAIVPAASRPGVDLTSPLSPLSSWRSDQAHGLVAGLATGLSAALVAGFVAGITTDVMPGLVIGLATWVGLGLVVWLVYPQAWSCSLAFAQLAASRGTPIRLLRFLEDARSRNVLRAVGPVYQFRHGRLQDRLASQEWAGGGAGRPQPNGTRETLVNAEFCRRRVKAGSGSDSHFELDPNSHNSGTQTAGSQSMTSRTCRSSSRASVWRTPILTSTPSGIGDLMLPCLAELGLYHHAWEGLARRISSSMHQLANRRRVRSLSTRPKIIARGVATAVPS
jgi:hypothetical protein